MTGKKKKAFIPADQQARNINGTRTLCRKGKPEREVRRIGSDSDEGKGAEKLDNPKECNIAF